MDISENLGVFFFSTLVNFYIQIHEEKVFSFAGLEHLGILTW